MPKLHISDDMIEDTLHGSSGLANALPFPGPVSMDTHKGTHYSELDKEIDDMIKDTLYGSSGLANALPFPGLVGMDTHEGTYYSELDKAIKEVKESAIQVCLKQNPSLILLLIYQIVIEGFQRR